MERRAPAKVQIRRRINLLLILIAIAGLVGSALVGYMVNNRNKHSLLKRAQTVADALPAEEILELNGSEQDLQKPAYQRLKSRLEHIRADNNDIRFAYITGQSQENVFFYADSEDPSSDDYSPPGQTYPEASEKFIASFSKGEAFVEGPYRDRWGTWISALAPMKDPKTNKVIAIAGIDSPAQNYFLQIGFLSLFPLLLAGIPFVVLWRARELEKRQREISELKTHFSAIISDELRTPLGGILWASRQLDKEGSKEFAPQHLETLTHISESTELCISTLNELTDSSIFNRLHSSKDFDTPVDITSLVADVQNMLRLAAAEKDISLTQTGSWPKQALILGDKALLKEALMSIVNNAIRYSLESGEVTLNYSHTKSQHIIGISDFGTGITTADQAKVLSGELESTSSSPASSGVVSLSIAKLIFERHKGKLWFENQDNYGTVVLVSLPVSTKHPSSIESDKF